MNKIFQNKTSGAFCLFEITVKKVITACSIFLFAHTSTLSCILLPKQASLYVKDTEYKNFTVTVYEISF